MERPTLYKRGAAADVMLQWRVWTEGATLYTEHGQVGGKLIKSAGNVKKGKNSGKANETTDESQAAKEAQAAHEKRIKRGGYRSDPTVAANYLHSVPMLAHKYPEHLAKGKVQFPVYMQPKLDGLRALGRVVSGDKKSMGFLQSRKLTHYVAPDHITDELADVLNSDRDFILDGELYCHEMSLGEINSAGKKYHKGETERLKLHVYDCTRWSVQYQTQEERFGMLGEFFSRHSELEHIVQVPTTVAEDDADVQRIYAEYVAAGYEGAIIRTSENTYEFDTRSHGLLKLKGFQEEEFEIVAMKSGSGKAAHWPVITCKNPKSTKGETFDVLPKGDDKAKRAMLALGNVVIGRMLTVQFHQWTAYGQPEHPRGIVIREDIDQ